jgi:hypothetical protein
VLALDSVLELVFFAACSVAEPVGWLPVSSGPAGMMSVVVCRLLCRFLDCKVKYRFNGRCQKDEEISIGKIQPFIVDSLPCLGPNCPSNKTMTLKRVA